MNKRTTDVNLERAVPSAVMDIMRVKVILNSYIPVSFWPQNVHGSNSHSKWEAKQQSPNTHFR